MTATGFMAGAEANATSYNDAVETDNPYVYWTFDDVSTNVVDEIRSISLAPISNVTRVAHTNYGMAANFDGVDGTRFYNGATGVGGIPSQLWALEMWVQVQGSLDGHRCEYLYESGINSGTAVYQYNNPGVIFDYYDTDKLELFSGAGRTTTNGPSLSDLNWHHVVLAFYGNSGGFGITNRQDFWIDGVLSKVTTSTFSAGFGFYHISIGSTWVTGVGAFQGRMDEFAVYDIGSSIGVVSTDPTAQIRFEDRLKELVAHPRSAELLAREASSEIYQYIGNYGPGSSPYDDTGNAKLKDGVTGSVNGADGKWVGVANSVDDGLPQPQIDFFLGFEQKLDAVKIDYLVDHDSGIYAPDRVRLSFSLDGITFANAVESWGFDDSADPAGALNGDVRSYLIDLADPELWCRFVRLEFYSDREWVYLGEVRFSSTAFKKGTVVYID